MHKLSKDIVNERLKDRGIVLLGEYVNNSTKSTFQCEYGHEWDTTPNHVMRGNGCPHCAGNLPLTKGVVNERLKDRGITLIGEYVNNSTKSTFQCEYGHEWDATPANIMSGNGCPHCSNKFPLTKDIVNERLKDRGIVLLGEYVNNSTKSTFQCEYGHEWDATPANIMSGNGCPHCAGKLPLSKDVVNERLKDRSIVLIGEYVTALTKSTFQCEYGHEWDTTPNSVMGGRGCPHCSNKFPLTKDIVNERLKDRGIVLLGEYVNNSTKSTFQCEYGHEWDATPANIMSGNGCPHCSNKFPLTKDIVNERLKDRGIVLLGEYVNNSTKSTFQCEYGHEWDTTPNHVMRGNGCPHCAEYGYNPSKSGYGYILNFSNRFIKYGISNVIEGRLRQHKRNGEYNIHYTRLFEDGFKAQEWERAVKKIFGGKYVDSSLCPDGWTETLEPRWLDEVTKILKNFT